MARTIVKNDRIEIAEACNGYYVYYGERSACMGDGVDMFDTPNGYSMTPGSSEFDQAMKDWAEFGTDEIIEAYFP